MTWAIDHPQRHRRFSPFGRFGRSRAAAAAPDDVRARALPIGAGAVGLWTILLAAWGGIAVFVGPLFGYHPTSTTSWQWTTQNWLLHVVPGAVGVFAGLVMLGTIGARSMGRRTGLGIASLMTMAAGAWFVIGPAAYRMFESSSPFSLTGSANTNFIDQIGANLGPGILLAILGGMAFKAGIANPRVVLERPVEAVPASAAAAAPAGTVTGTPGRGGPTTTWDDTVPGGRARTDEPGAATAARERTDGEPTTEARTVEPGPEGKTS